MSCMTGELREVAPDPHEAAEALAMVRCAVAGQGGMPSVRWFRQQVPTLYGQYSASTDTVWLAVGLKGEQLQRTVGHEVLGHRAQHQMGFAFTEATIGEAEAWATKAEQWFLTRWAPHAAQRAEVEALDGGELLERGRAVLARAKENLRLTEASARRFYGDLWDRHQAGQVKNTKR